MRYRRPTLQPFFTFFYLTLGGAFLLFFRLLLLEKSKHLEQNKFELKDFLLNSVEANFSQCKILPEFVRKQIENDYWQVLETSNGTFKMFNAYYENRKSLVNGSAIRILAYIDRPFPSVETFCQLWFRGIEGPVVVKTFEYHLMWHLSWGINSEGSQPHLVSCKNPFAAQGLVPVSVSLVESKCDVASNNLEVIYNEPEIKAKKPFAVCAKDLDFMDDQTMQIIEWIEILSLLGADKIFIYVIKIHRNMMKTLKFYERQGKVKVEMIAEPKGLPNRTESLTQWLQNGMISLNDCLYKHMYEYEYLSPLDIDEIILPNKPEDRTWSDLLKRIVDVEMPSNEDAFVAQNVFFLSDNIHEGEIQPEVPNNMYFLQHVYRAVNFSEPNVGPKSFQNTEQVLVMHNHFPMHCIGKEYCKYSFIPKEAGKLQHYRRDCENYPKEECNGFKVNTVKDLTLWKYKDELTSNFKKTLKALDLMS